MAWYRLAKPHFRWAEYNTSNLQLVDLGNLTMVIVPEVA